MEPFTSAGLGPLLPIVTCLIALPSLYIYLSIEAHREYAAFIHDLSGKGMKKKQLEELTNGLKGELELFEMDWWIMAAFAVLIAGIMAIGHAPGWVQDSCPKPTDQPSILETGMSAYATAIGLVMAFRLGWARMMLGTKLQRCQQELLG